MSARNVIAKHLCTMAAQGWSGVSAFERAAYRTTALGMINTLTSSGYRILGPDEIDAVTVEKCAEVAASHFNFHRVDKARIAGGEIATAIRALKENRT